jgi:hypothetical protein
VEQGDDRWQVARWPSVKARDVDSLSFAELEALLLAQKDHNRDLGSHDEHGDLFSDLPEAELNDLAMAVQARVVAETDLLDRFSRLGLDPFAPDLLSLPLPYPVILAPATDSAVIQGGVRAFYRQGCIHLAGAPPSLAERLALLSSRGIIGNDLFHEVFHGLQDDGTEFHSLEEVLDAVVSSESGLPDHKVAVAEAHAWLRCLPGFRHDLIAEVVGGCYAIEGTGLRTAIELVFSLAVLGLDDEEIGQLVAQATWCPEMGSYVELEMERQRLLALAGWTLGDLGEAIARQHLLERLHVMRAIGIARESAHAARKGRRSEGDLAGVVGSRVV